MNPYSWIPDYYQNPNVYIPQGYIPHWSTPGWNHYDGTNAGAQAFPMSKKYPTLNPALASDVTHIRFDVKTKPSQSIHPAAYQANRLLYATANKATAIRLISRSFPWTIDIQSPLPITCEGVWDAIHTALQAPIVESEWALISAFDTKHKDLLAKIIKKREEGGEPPLLKRIDYLGDATILKGLEKDEDYSRSMLLPGGKAIPETWVVKLST
ncbi:hypothetical protein AX16_002014 [Volvariella volvacea WC 439]|nr:hypothetical protein AX16_002014 [Volvariella volvacea WC 439]